MNFTDNRTFILSSVVVVLSLGLTFLGVYLGMFQVEMFEEALWASLAAVGVYAGKRVGQSVAEAIKKNNGSTQGDGK